MTAAANRTDHLAPLDGLRGFAILHVMWYHVWQQSWLGTAITLFGVPLTLQVIPETGFLGVDLFFFVSGFCLFYPYARTLFDGRPMQSVPVFAYRRAIKILPSYWIAIVGGIGLGLNPFTSWGDGFRQVWTHLLFVHNLFPETFNGIDNVMWSLGTEVQFYVAFPIVCWFVMRWPFLTFAASAAIASLYRFLVAYDYEAPHEIDRLQGTIDLFVAGMLAAWLYRAIPAKAPKFAANRAYWTFVALAGLVLYYFALQHTYDTRSMPGWGTASKVFSRPEVIAAVVPLTVGSLLAYPWLQRLIANPLLTFLSFISYNLYLWHQEIAAALRIRNVIPFSGTDPHADVVWRWVFNLVTYPLVIGIAWLLTAFLEQPLLRRRPFEAFFARLGRPANPKQAATAVP